jgi:hypothetical protein
MHHHQLSLALDTVIWYTLKKTEQALGTDRMSEQEKNKDLEDLFATFDKQFAECEQKFNQIEENLKAFREEQEDSDSPDPPAEKTE